MHHDLLFRAANYRPLPPPPRHHAHPNAYPTTTSSANPVDWGVCYERVVSYAAALVTRDHFALALAASHGLPAHDLL
ncbi:hypothetical protein NHJ13051_001195 [Beauveria bassiana]